MKFAGLPRQALFPRGRILKGSDNDAGRGGRMENKIRELRRKKGLSSKTIGQAVGTSQQHIQLIEKGLSCPDFDLSAKICKVVGASFQTVFPSTRQAIMSYRTRKDQNRDLFQDSKFIEDMLSAGIDMSLEKWVFSYALRGGAKGNLPISSTEKKKLSDTVQGIFQTAAYAVFDAICDRILLNLDHLIFHRFLFEGQLPGSSRNKALQDKTNSVRIYVCDRATPFTLRAGPDTALLENSTGWEAAQLQSILMSARLAEKTNVLMIADKAGEVSFFKLRDVALMKIPLENIEIALTGNAPITR